MAWAEADADPIVDQQDTTSRSNRTNPKQPDRQRDGASSVRPRGREAPITLRQVAVEETPIAAAGGADPGDGPPPSRKKRAPADRGQDKRDRSARAMNLRVWPMPAESYTFTQAFGCVPQIAHFYQPGAGCPADRPVVHTGLDLAAPEGTPFYAAASGWVTEAGYDRDVGVANTRIIIQHEGRNERYATEYLHWVASFVDVGDYVEAGQLIGEVGSVGYSTGPHLHFSLIDLDSGEHTDPTRWLPNEPGTEGYRGITPRRAAMRLPAGTTAGVPEYTDPSPPPLPEREVVPDAPSGEREERAKKKKKKNKQREERRENRGKKKRGKNKEKDTREVSGKEGATAEKGKRGSEDRNNKRERTRKRERNRDGRAESRNASGEDASGKDKSQAREKRRDKKANERASDGGKRANRKGKNTVEQTDTRKNADKGDRKNSNGGNKKNRKKQDAQQAYEETPPTDATPPPADEQPPEEHGTPDQDGQDPSDGANGDDGNAQGSPDENTEQDAATSDEDTEKQRRRDRRNAEETGESTKRERQDGGKNRESRPRKNK